MTFLDHVPCEITRLGELPGTRLLCTNCGIEIAADTPTDARERFDWHARYPKVIRGEVVTRHAELGTSLDP